VRPEHGAPTKEAEWVAAAVGERDRAGPAWEAQAKPGARVCGGNDLRTLAELGRRSWVGTAAVAAGSPGYGAVALAGCPGSAPGIRLEFAHGSRKGSRKDGRKSGRGQAGSGEGRPGDGEPATPKEREAMEGRQKTLNEKNEEAEKLEKLFTIDKENEADIVDATTA
jgi:hypothetical protein